MLEPWAVRTALQEAITRLTALQVHPLLSSSEQALCGELRQADTLALNALRADGTIVPGQRGARAQQIEDKVFALDTVEAAHEDVIGIDAFYNALDMSADAAGAIRLGLATYVSDYASR